MPGETVNNNSNEALEQNNEWDTLRNFAGERNINDATGKERTFTEFDLYPRLKGESAEEYGERLKHMHEMTAEYLENEAQKEEEAKAILNTEGIRTNTYEESEFGKTELAAEASYDALEAKLDKAVAEGRMSQDAANRLLERKMNETYSTIEGARQDYKDRQAVGTEEEQQRYEEFLKSHAEENEKNLAERVDTHELEEKAKHELEEKAKHELEETAKHELEEKEKMAEDLKKAAADAKRRYEEISEILQSKPLVAINADFSLDKKELAEHEAERLADKNGNTGGYFKRLWKGTLFKKYYQKKFERELLEGKRTFEDKADGQEKTIEQAIAERSGSALERFELGITENMDYIHTEIGKKSKNGEYKNGEEVVEADEKTQNFVKSQIESFVAAHKDEQIDPAKLRLQFNEQFGHALAEARDNGEELDVTNINNYGNVALQALELTAHGESMDRVMEGFKVYNAKVNDEIRTKTHRDAVDTIVNAVESSAFGSVIPAEVIALTIGTAASLAQMGARSVANAVAPAAGGILVSSAISGLRERNRITEDRYHMMRDIANGLEYGEGENKSRRQEKYEKRIGGTLYDLRSASDLAENIKAAMDAEESNEKSENILRALAEARVRRDLSDSEQKDLISFASAGKRGDERLELDKTLIRGEHALSAQDKEKYEAIKAEIQKQIMDGYTTEDGEHIAGVTEQDRKFANRRALMATAKAGKTLALGAVFFFGSQEVMAALDPNKIGVFEKVGLLKTNNNNAANETLLASGFGLRRGSYEKVLGFNKVEVSADDTQQIQNLQNSGYTGVMTEKPYTTTVSTLTEVDPGKSDLAHNIVVDGWANNGTKISDGNELRMYIQNGLLVSGMKGQSTMGNQAFDINSLTQADRIKAFVTLNGERFELAQTGVNQWGNGNGIFDVIGPDGSTGTVKIIGDAGEKLYDKMEFAVDNGIGTDGLRHIIPLATDPNGSGAVGKISQIVEKTIEHPGKFVFTKIFRDRFARGISGEGIAFAPDTARQGLGEATARREEQAPGPIQEPTPTAEPTPSQAEPTPMNTFSTGNAAPTPSQNQEPTPMNTFSTGNAAPNTPPASPEAQRNDEETTLSRMVDNSSSIIGGEEGVNILKSNDLTNRDNPTRFQNWWNSLSPAGKDRVELIMNAIRSTNDRRTQRSDSNLVETGGAFYNWYNANVAA